MSSSISSSNEQARHTDQSPNSPAATIEILLCFQEFIRAAAKEDKRVDGRGLFDHRKVCVALSSAPSSHPDCSIEWKIVWALATAAAGSGESRHNSRRRRGAAGHYPCSRQRHLDRGLAPMFFPHTSLEHAVESLARSLCLTPTPAAGSAGRARTGRCRPRPRPAGRRRAR